MSLGDPIAREWEIVNVSKSPPASRFAAMRYPNLDRMWIDAVRFQIACDRHKLVHSNVRILALFALLMQLDHLVV